MRDIDSFDIDINMKLLILPSSLRLCFFASLREIKNHIKNTQLKTWNYT
jgi:hypothetical protein